MCIFALTQREIEFIDKHLTRLPKVYAGTENEVISIVSLYIRHRKGIRVSINVLTDNQKERSIYMPHIATNEFDKLFKAYHTALKWFADNEDWRIKK